MPLASFSLTTPHNALYPRTDQDRRLLFPDFLAWSYHNPDRHFAKKASSYLQPVSFIHSNHMRPMSGPTADIPVLPRVDQAARVSALSITAGKLGSRNSPVLLASKASRYHTINRWILRFMVPRDWRFASISRVLRSLNLAIHVFFQATPSQS